MPRIGGVILAKSNGRRELDEILLKDPFRQYLCAEYQVHEFAVNNGTVAFKGFLKNSGLIQ